MFWDEPFMLGLRLFGGFALLLRGDVTSWLRVSGGTRVRTIACSSASARQG